MNYEDLTPDMKDKIRACKTPEELLELAKESGYELSDKELEQISGGWGPTSTASSMNVVAMNVNLCTATKFAAISPASPLTATRIFRVA